MRKIVNAKGMSCPRPLMLTKKALQKLNVGEEMIVLIDNKISRENVERFLSENGAESVCTEGNGVFKLSVRKVKEKENTNIKVQACKIGSPKSNVIVFKENKMESGADELGAMLVKGFLQSVIEVEPLPGTIVFYNKGIELALKTSPVIEFLKELENIGVKILVCGTCLEYYKKTEEVGVGIVSNMYDIASALANADHIIYP